MSIRIVVGLGNPGIDYDHTRHNVGFDVLDELAKLEGISFRRSWRIPAQVAWIQLAEHKVMLIKPMTFMNRSGKAVKKALKRMKARPEDVLVVYDDVDMTTGKIRLRTRGGSGGHNGVRSIVGVLRTEDFPRLRVGVGPRPEGKDLIKYVLSKWPEEVEERIGIVCARSAESIRYSIEFGIDQGMNKYNSAFL
jgi:PTH1 family peptidyl-tRNA hydrolase